MIFSEFVLTASMIFILFMWLEMVFRISCSITFAGIKVRLMGL